MPRGELWLGVGSRRRSPLSERDQTRGVVGTTASAVAVRVSTPDILLPKFLLNRREEAQA